MTRSLLTGILGKVSTRMHREIATDAKREAGNNIMMS